MYIFIPADFVNMFWKLFDFDQNDVLDEREFIVGLSLLMKGTPRQKLMQIFRAFDVDNSTLHALIGGYAPTPQASGTL